MDVPCSAIMLCSGSMLSQPLSEQPMPAHSASSHPPPPNRLPSQAEFNAPCRTTKYPREIPPLPWYRQTLPQMLMAGFLPFSAIYIELCEFERRLGWEEGQMAGLGGMGWGMMSGEQQAGGPGWAADGASEGE